MSFVDTAQEAIFGDPIDPGKEPSPELMLQAFEEIEAAMKKVLIGNITLYCRADATGAGDTTGGLDDNAGAAFSGGTVAYDYVKRHYYVPPNCVVTISTTGTFDEGFVCAGKVEGGGRVDFVAARSAVTSAAGAVIEADGESAFTLSGGAYVRLIGFGLEAPDNYGIWSIDGASIIEYGLCDIRDCDYGFYETRGGRGEMIGDVGVNGNMLALVQSSHQGNWRRSGGTFKLLKNCTMSTCTLYSEGLGDLTISGVGTVFDANGFTCTGAKYKVDPSALLQWFGGVINLDNIFGSFPGVVGQGGDVYTGTQDQDPGPFVPYGPRRVAYVPTVSVGGGSIGGSNVYSGRYQFHGLNCKVSLKAVFSSTATSGSPAGNFSMALPGNVVPAFDTVWTGYTVDGAIVNGIILAGASVINITVAGLGTPVANSRTLIIGGEYEFNPLA